MTAPGDLDRQVRGLIRDVPDWPTPGVTFKDIGPLLADHSAVSGVVEWLADGQTGAVDLVAGIEARGFLLGAPVALACGAGFIPVRKAGKLPAPTISASYDLEYASATIELQSELIVPGARVLVIDDVLATGGTARATVELLRSVGAEVVGVSVLIELSFLAGRDLLPGLDVKALLAM